MIENLLQDAEQAKSAGDDEKGSTDLSACDRTLRK